jgi:hypothetical protein
VRLAAPAHLRAGELRNSPQGIGAIARAERFKRSFLKRRETFLLLQSTSRGRSRMRYAGIPAWVVHGFIAAWPSFCSNVMMVYSLQSRGTIAEILRAFIGFG